MYERIYLHIQIQMNYMYIYAYIIWHGCSGLEGLRSAYPIKSTLTYPRLECML
jgi:hypothetical protein